MPFGGDSVQVSDLRPADLIFVHGDSFIDRSIEDITHSKYSHVALVVNQSELIEAQDLSRVHYQDMGVYVNHADVYRCELIRPPQQEEIVQNAKKYIGRHYSYLLIAWEFIRYTFGILLPFYEHDPVICSTLIADAYRQSKINICPNIKYPSP